MKIWKQFPFLLSLTLVATGFRTDFQPVEQSADWASESRQSYAELQPYLEDMIRQIQKSKNVPEFLSKGPQVIPATTEELQKSPALVTVPVETKPVVKPVEQPVEKPVQKPAVAQSTTQALRLPEWKNPLKNGDVLVPQTSMAAAPVEQVEDPYKRYEVENAPVPLTKPQQVEGGVTLPSGTTCASCEKEQKNLTFNQCSEKNDYLEAQISEARESGSLIGDLVRKGAPRSGVIKPQCMRTAMVTKLSESIEYFRKCSPGQNSALTKSATVRPCMSENYFAMVANSFDLAARCMAPMMASAQADQRREIRALFGMFTVESGMHLNTMNPGGDAGFGQLTESAIKSVNQNALSKIRESLTEQGGLCKRLANEILRNPMRADVTRSCDRISIAKGNPLANLVYSMANVMENKDIIKDDVMNDDILKKRFDLTSSDKNRLLTALAVWAHNTGSGGMKKPLISLLNSTYRNAKVTDVDKFIREMKSAMVDYPHRANRGERRKRITSKYYSDIVNQITKIETNAGGGSCLGSSL